MATLTPTYIYLSSNLNRNIKSMKLELLFYYTRNIERKFEKYSYNVYISYNVFIKNVAEYFTKITAII